MKLLRILIISLVAYIFLYGVIRMVIAWFPVGFLSDFIPKPKLAVLMAVLFSIVASLSVKRKEKFRFWKDGWEVMAGYIGISLFVGFYLSASYIHINGIIASLVVLLFLPGAIGFFFDHKGKEVLFWKSPLMLVITAVFIIGGTFFYQNDEAIRSQDTYTVTHPHIISVEPKMVSNFDWIIIKGTGFGERINDKFKVVGEASGPLDVADWGSERIVIKLNTTNDPGEIKVVREAYYQKGYQVFESNPIKLDFYKLGESTPEQQKRYFEQLNNMSDEAKKIYGINPY